MPLVARHARQPREQTREQLNIAKDKKVTLISFGGFGLQEFDFSPLAKLDDWVFITERDLSTPAPNILSLINGHYSYPDLVAAADVIVTKPGYGIVSEAIANQRAVLYTSRGDFPEEPLLIEGLQRYTRCREISNHKLRSGDWHDALEALLDPARRRGYTPHGWCRYNCPTSCSAAWKVCMNKHDLQSIFTLLLDHFGPRNWWPAESPFEVLVGAILTQNTAWRNVEQAIENLEQAGALQPQTMARIELGELEKLIRPSGFYRQKAARLHAITRLLCTRYADDIAQLCAGSLEDARERLLALRGVGPPETADAILLYAAERPSFVVDAYTLRLFNRLGLLSASEAYEQVRARFMAELPHDVELFNEYHALIVAQCKDICRKQKPRCPICPLEHRCPRAHTI